MSDKEYWQNEMIKGLGLTQKQWIGDEPTSPCRCKSGYEIDRNMFHSEDFNFWWYRGNQFVLTKDNRNIIYCSVVNIGSGYFVSANPFNKTITVRAGSGEFNQNDILNQNAVVKIKKVFEGKKDDPKCIKLLKFILRREFDWN